MFLSINNKINENQTKDNEITGFIKDLEKSLKVTESQAPTMYKELLAEFPLAEKYPKETQELIDEAMTNLSYEYDFYYYDYDRNSRKYFLDYYSDGNVVRTNLSRKRKNMDKGTFWQKTDQEDGLIIKSYGFKENIRLNVDEDLKWLDLEKNNKMNKGWNYGKD